MSKICQTSYSAIKLGSQWRARVTVNGRTSEAFADTRALALLDAMWPR